jgi:hypothetical protein
MMERTENILHSSTPEQGYEKVTLKIQISIKQITYAAIK